jgi:uncharacterized membrane protein
MSLAQLHLLINHLPVFGAFLGMIVLAHGMWTKNGQTKIAAYNLFILSAIGACIAYFTGEPAEEVVENIAGITESAIEQHEDFAIFALISFILLGVVSVFGLLITLKQSIFMRPVAVVILLISLVSFVLVARTGYLGGQIRHTEMNTSPAGEGVQNSGSENGDD